MIWSATSEGSIIRVLCPAVGFLRRRVPRSSVTELQLVKG